LRKTHPSVVPGEKKTVLKASGGRHPGASGQNRNQIRSSVGQEGPRWKTRIVERFSSAVGTWGTFKPRGSREAGPARIPAIRREKISGRQGNRKKAEESGGWGRRGKKNKRGPEKFRHRRFNGAGMNRAKKGDPLRGRGVIRGHPPKHWRRRFRGGNVLQRPGRSWGGGDRGIGNAPSGRKRTRLTLGRENVVGEPPLFRGLGHRSSHLAWGFRFGPG